MNFLILVVKGFIIGIAKVIPGVSGSVLMITLGLYEKCLFAITHFYKNIKEHTRLLFGIGIGVVAAIILGSKIIAFLLNSYQLQIILLFLGLIMGGLPSFIKQMPSHSINMKRILVFWGCFSLVLMIPLFHIHFNINLVSVPKIIFLIIGFLDAVTMIIPGISGTALLLLLGLYEIAIHMFASLSNVTSIFQNFSQLFIYGIGLFIGILLVSFLMNYLFQKHSSITHYAILGFQCSSILALLLQVLQFSYSFFDFLVGLFFLVLGICFSQYLEKWS